MSRFTVFEYRQLIANLTHFYVNDRQCFHIQSFSVSCRVRPITTRFAVQSVHVTLCINCSIVREKRVITTSGSRAGRTIELIYPFTPCKWLQVARGGAENRVLIWLTRDETQNYWVLKHCRPQLMSADVIFDPLPCSLLFFFCLFVSIPLSVYLSTCLRNCRNKSVDWRRCWTSNLQTKYGTDV